MSATAQNGAAPAKAREGAPEQGQAAAPSIWQRLREPFPAEKLGKLKRKQKQEDGGYREVLLDYVGHADVTDRLLSVDPEWNWEPMATDTDGLPLFVGDPDHPRGLWIKLTVGGITRLGFGSVGAGAFDAEKQLIGDAIRNAAMRFGVALDLWRKEEPPDTTDDQPPSTRHPRPSQQQRAAGDATPPAPAVPALSGTERAAIVLDGKCEECRKRGLTTYTGKAVGWRTPSGQDTEVCNGWDPVAPNADGGKGVYMLHPKPAEPEPHPTLAGASGEVVDPEDIPF